MGDSKGVEDDGGRVVPVPCTGVEWRGVGGIEGLTVDGAALAAAQAVLEDPWTRDRDVRSRPDEAWWTVAQFLDVGTSREKCARVIDMGEVAPTSLLVTGAPGSGKSAFVAACLRLLAERRGLAVRVVTPWGLAAEHPGEMDIGLRTLLDDALEASRGGDPTVIVLEDLDALFPPVSLGGGEEGAEADGGDLEQQPVTLSEAESLTVHEMVHFMDAVLQRRIGVAKGPRCVVVGITTSAGGVNPRIASLFQERTLFDVPSPQHRKFMFRAAFADVIKASSELSATVDEVADRAHGFVAADIGAAVRSFANCDSQSPEELRRVATTQPFMLSSGIGGALSEITTPSVSWLDIAGLSDIKELLREMVVLPQTHPEVFADLGVTPPTGTLLYGVPGTGKTLLAKAVATECSANFVSVSISEIVKSGVGDSEKAISSVFQLATSCAPCVLFIDEFQALFSQRSDGDSSSSHLTSQLINEMSRIAQARETLLRHSSGAVPQSVHRAAGVTVLAATNMPEMVDKALCRPGRFDRAVHVRPPNKEERAALLRSLAASMRVADDINYDHVAMLTGTYSGADLANVCRQAALAAIEENLAADVVSMAHFDTALASTTGSVSRSRIAELNKWTPKS